MLTLTVTQTLFGQVFLARLALLVLLGVGAGAEMAGRRVAVLSGGRWC